MKFRNNFQKYSALFFLLAVIYGVHVDLKSRPIPFNSKQWKENFSLRSRMVHSLLEKNHMVGLNREEVEEQLGSPDHIRTDDTSFTLYYYTNRHEVLNWLVLKFIDNKMVESRIGSS